MADQPGIPLPALKARLDKGAVAPVYLIASVDGFLADEAVRLILDAVAAQGGEPARTRYRGDEADLAAVLDHVRTKDLFSPRRVIIVSPADQFVQSHSAGLAKYAARPPAGSCLILVVDKVDGRQKFVKAMDKMGSLVVCRRLYERDIPVWITARVRSMGRRIEPDAAQMLADFLGTDLAPIATELDKLAAYLADRKDITVADVEAVSLRDHGREVFHLCDAIGRRNPAAVIEILRKLLDDGGKPARIVFFASRHLRRLWAVKEQIMGGVDPRVAAATVGQRYFVEPFLEQVNALSPREIRRSVSELVRCEAALKTSTMDESALLETTFLRLVLRGAKSAASG